MYSSDGIEKAFVPGFVLKLHIGDIFELTLLGSKLCAYNLNTSLEFNSFNNRSVISSQAAFEFAVINTQSLLERTISRTAPTKVLVFPVPVKKCVFYMIREWSLGCPTEYELVQLDPGAQFCLTYLVGRIEGTVTSSSSYQEWTELQFSALRSFPWQMWCFYIKIKKIDTILSKILQRRC